MTARGPRIAVCGGGLAGIAAACELAGRGAAVTLVERRPFLGGRAFSFRDRRGREIDNGQHVFLGCCPAYVRLMDLLGTSIHLHRQRRLRVPVLDRDGRSAELRADPLPTPLHMTRSLLRYGHLTRAERARAGAAMLALAACRGAALERLDEISFADWLTEQDQTERSISRFWDVVVLATCNERSSAVSAALAAFVFQEGVLSSTTASAIGWSLVGLSRLVDPAAEDYLRARGGSVLRGVEARTADPGGVTLSDGRRVDADGVVVALPPARARAIAPEALPEDPGLGVSPIVNVHLWYERPITHEPVLAVLESPAQWVFSRRAMERGRGPGDRVVVSISAAHEHMAAPRAELAETVASELERVLPGARGLRPSDWTVVKEARATFAPSPGQAARRPGPTTPVTRVALAGAWTATGWPATMEGAVRSGIRAARAVLEDVG